MTGEEWVDGYMNNPIADEPEMYGHLLRAFKAGSAYRKQKDIEIIRNFNSTQIPKQIIQFGLIKTIKESK